MAWNIVLLESGTINQSNKLQALSLISDCYRHQMDLSTNAGIIEEAMRFHSSNTELLNKMAMPNKLEQKDSDGATTSTQDNNETTTTTTNGVF